ncbi:polysaccharide biosynthesis protein [Gammaproteobacteria bacterium]|nr:polysaccharide biosynthesis protein [Gammaproteobacteria bacterium]
MTKALINMPRIYKQLLIASTDAIMLVSILFLAFSIRLGFWYWPDEDLLWVIFGAPVIAIPIFIVFDLYHGIVRFLGLRTLWAVVQAVSLYGLIWGIIGFMTAIDGIPRSVIMINWLLAIVGIGGARMLARWLLSDDLIRGRKNVLIYGAGSSGRQLAEALSQSSEYKPVAFIDDQKDLIKQSLNGIRIYTDAALPDLINKYQIQEVLLALNTPSKQKYNQIINRLENFPVHLRILPSVSELAQGKVKIGDLREVNIDDVLGREKVGPNWSLLHTDIEDKVVMVTGAGGSIGSELCRQILNLGANKLILFEQSELALYNIDKELNKHKGVVYPILGSVTDQTRLERVCQKFSVETIYHAAAYKHVPMVEFNSTEGVTNNIFGTLNCAQAAINSKVKTFVLISTDKAVRPTNTMGATKRSAELVLQALAKHQNSTRFSMVRFGNVLDSSGSVIPLFRQQIQQGGPVTVTDKAIVRYFMTIPEAVELVIQAGAMAHGGEVFVLDMGEPIKIFDLAVKMIHLSGLSVKDKENPDGDIEIRITGLRPGEKLFEELLIGDNVNKTKHPMIMMAQEDRLSWQQLNKVLEQMQTALDACDQSQLRELLVNIVPGFKPQCGIEDILYRDY